MPRKSLFPRRAYIHQGLYKKILEVLPIACVDAVIVHDGKFLLGKRRNKPAQGRWCLIGGRVVKGESLTHAVLRKAREETGLKGLKVKKFLTTRGTFFKDSLQGPPSHTINSVFLVRTSSNKFSLRDTQNEDLRWFSHIDRNWLGYVREVLRLAGFH